MMMKIYPLHKHLLSYLRVAGSCLLLLVYAENSFGFTPADLLKVSDLLCENMTNPIGLDAKQPYFSWQLSGNQRGLMQVAYEIRVGRNKTALAQGKDLVWKSGKVNSDQSVHIPYKGNPLSSAAKYYWQVKVWDAAGKSSAWSDIAFWQMGLLNSSDWKAKWIKQALPESPGQQPSPLFRKEFLSGKKIASATAFITAHGLYEAFINGHRIGDDYLTPGWTSYNKRLQYQVYDVTSMIQDQQNAVGLMLGSGWFRGRLAWETKNQNIFGAELGLLFQMLIVYTDGSSATIVSDESWKNATGPLVSSSLYDGEVNDARLEKAGWKKPGYNDKDWIAVKTYDFDNSKLVATSNEPVKKHETLKPVKIFKTPAGEQVVDFGQNMVGYVQLKISGNAGDKITLSHAEVLDKAGNFYTTNLRTAKQEAVYILNGNGEETFDAHFTFYGFRYVKIEGFKGVLKPEQLTAIALYSAMKSTGGFACSNPLLNQLQHNIQWGQKGNFVDVPTDCPQRDERLGWTGDAQAFCRTAAFNMRVDNFFSKWLKDLAADQLPNGSVPYVVPNVLGPKSQGSTGWADAATIIPWNMYCAFGNEKILQEQYPSMKAWVDFMTNNSKDALWNTGFHIGDWLFYRPADDPDGMSAVTDKYLIAQCFYAHSTQLLINSAKVLGKADEVEKYQALLKKIKLAFLGEYVTPNGRLISGTQTAYVLALNFDMLPEEYRAAAAKKLVSNIKDYNNHLTTGFLGTPYLCDVLTRFGYLDVAYTLLMQETYPSWLYPVTMGATTIWERWDGIKPDGNFQNPDMNSFNHYAYGAIGDWMYRTIAGINASEGSVGYKSIFIKPRIGGGLHHASATLETYYGQLSSSWKITGGTFVLEVTIPANTTATIHIPATNPKAITESGKALESLKALKITGTDDPAYVAVKVGSGSYQFSVTNH